MKTQTKIDDLKKLIAARAARRVADLDTAALTAAIPCQSRDQIIAILDRSIASRAAATVAAQPLEKLPVARHLLAAATAKAALEIGRRAALSGESYSGATDMVKTETRMK